jgi:hypothetical protein
MERSTVQSCLAAPFLLENPSEISIKLGLRLIVGFGYVERNRPRMRVSTDTKPAQRFAFCPRTQVAPPDSIRFSREAPAGPRERAFAVALPAGGTCNAGSSADPVPTHERLGPDDCENLRDQWVPTAVGLTAPVCIHRSGFSEMR